MEIMTSESRLFSAYSEDPSFDRLRVGDISSDNSTIVGRENLLYLFLGSNNYYHQYSHDLSDTNGLKWAELTRDRHEKFSKHSQIISLFIPNKVSCIPDLYPLPLNVLPTKAWSDLQICLEEDSGVMFCDSLIENSSIKNRRTKNPWRLVDSHWSEFGCLQTTNDILIKLGLRPIEFLCKDIEPLLKYGDLSDKFGAPIIGELCHQEIYHEYPCPIKTYDSGGESPYQGSVGRRVTWENAESSINLHLLIVGNSFSGHGDNTSHLTYWMARIFRKVTFLHSGHLPTDALSFYNPAVILFQGLERFLISVPDDTLTTSQIEAVFKS
jgi:hypothetical protein